ncbi:Polcalcin Nic t 1 [Fasciola hepatica]|uniref:Polcalcin Nic t 1 n=1 Tax=Fasciola hepatica TaxID=6192 RepID=A0A4E0RJZ0_FASHE|nr:Polcalcin Nic t 1 [Fasciola hepatica]
MDENEIYQIFKTMDLNGDGKVSRKELRKFFKSHAYKWSSKELKEYIKQIDTDGDGYISYQELRFALGKR